MVSVIVVTYNSREHITSCLKSLHGSGAEIVVVDNASSDGTADQVKTQFPEVKLISAPSNIGFAAACNLGARESTGSSFLFLNPDIVCTGSISDLEAALLNSKENVAVAPRLVDSYGHTQAGFNIRRLPTSTALLFEILLLNRLFPNNAVNRRYRCLDMNYDESAEVEQPAAAALLVSRRRFHVCCGFDESFYPLWFEDVDLCKRLRSDGGKILYWPKVTFRHVGGHSIDSISFREKQVYWYRNMLYYVRKHFSWAEGIMIRFAIVFGMALRILAEFLGLGKKLSDRRLTLRESVSAYLSVAKLSLLDWK